MNLPLKPPIQSDIKYTTHTCGFIFRARIYTHTHIHIFPCFKHPFPTNVGRARITDFEWMGSVRGKGWKEEGVRICRGGEG